MNDRNNDRGEKRINVEQVVNYLSHAFAKASAKAAPKIGRAAVRAVVDGQVETTRLYDYQVEFCYLIDEIQRGPSYIVPKVIQDANQLILDLEREGSRPQDEATA